MNNTHKTLGIVAVSVLVFGAVGMVGLTQVSAQSESDTYPPIIQNLAEKFGLKETEVHEVFEANREQRHDDRMSALIEDGTLTQEQADLLDAKHEELREKRQELWGQSQTMEERHEAMQAFRDEMQTWAEENDIPFDEIRGQERGQSRIGGFGMGMHSKSL